MSPQWPPQMWQCCSSKLQGAPHILVLPAIQRLFLSVEIQTSKAQCCCTRLTRSCGCLLAISVDVPHSLCDLQFLGMWWYIVKAHFHQVSKSIATHSSFVADFMPRHYHPSNLYLWPKKVIWPVVVITGTLRQNLYNLQLSIFE